MHVQIGGMVGFSPPLRTTVTCAPPGQGGLKPAIPALAVCLAFLPAALADQTLSTVRVYTSPPGVQFRVDGASFTGSATFMWPAGSKHTLVTDDLQSGIYIGKRHRFRQWVANSTAIMPLVPGVTITADPAISSFRAEFVAEYALSLVFNQCDGVCAASPGTVYVNRDPYTTDAVLWFVAGSAVEVQAAPLPGFVFLGWTQSAGATIQGFINNLVMSEPRWVYPRFQVARRINLATSPPGLRLMADRSLVHTPIALEWGWNTAHTLEPVSPQLDSEGKTWVFASWSDAAASLRSYQVAPLSSEDTVTARFIPGYRLTFLTDPPGLKLLVDGRGNWTGAYNYDWGEGETHRVEAPASQTGAEGRQYVFRGWSNGGSRVQDLTVAAHARLTAAYDLQGRLTVQSTLPNLVVSIDGEACAVPCTLDRPQGAAVKVSAPASVAQGEDARWDFQGWGDDAAPERTVTLGAEAVSLRAGYALKNRLLAVSEPEGGARWRMEPAAADGFYDPRATVAVAVEPAPGFRFRRWEGDLAGSHAAGALRMSAPRAVRAVFDKVPYLPSAAVRNAAADLPGEGVAAGSLIAILGLNLSEASETGPISPLAQTLAGVTVRLGDRLLPLLSVTPERIDAHLPWDIEPGAHLLAVRYGTAPEVSAGFIVVRNAPGLFTTGAVRAGDTVTLLGTGLGPYQFTPIEGFPIPQSPAWPLLDAVEVLLGEEVLTPLSAVAQPGAIGVDAVTFRAPAGPLRVAVRVNGAVSNSVEIQ